MKVQRSMRVRRPFRPVGPLARRRNVLQPAQSNRRTRTRHAALFLFLSSIPVALACDDGDGVTAVSAGPTVTGTVVNSATSDPVAGAVVSVGSVTVTTGPDGRFQLTDLAAGPAKLRSTAAGFEDFEMDVTVPSGTLTQDISLTPVDLATPLQITAFLSYGVGPQRDRVQASIIVLRGGVSIDDATVTVNDFAVPRSSRGPGYEAVLAEPTGSSLLLEVRTRGLIAQATGHVPEALVLTGPAEGATFALADDIAVSWTSTTDPDGFEAWLDTDFCCFSLGLLPGTARDLSIPAGNLGVGNHRIVVASRNEVSFTGQADPASRLAIDGDRAEVGVAVTQ